MAMLRLRRKPNYGMCSTAIFNEPFYVKPLSILPTRVFFLNDRKVLFPCVAALSFSFSINAYCLSGCQRGRLRFAAAQ